MCPDNLVRPYTMFAVPSGASHIALALPHTSSLQHLDLSGNGVAADTCMVLREVLRVRCCTLTMAGIVDGV
jgi:hypothetical protein